MLLESMVADRVPHFMVHMKEVNPRCINLEDPLERSIALSRMITQHNKRQEFQHIQTPHDVVIMQWLDEDLDDPSPRTRFGTIEIAFSTPEQANEAILHGLKSYGELHTCEKYPPPKPLSCCERCSRWDHSKATCRAPERCCWCSGDHSWTLCPEEGNMDAQSCAHCGGEHAAFDLSCEYGQTERKRITAERRLFPTNATITATTPKEKESPKSTNNLATPSTSLRHRGTDADVIWSQQSVNSSQSSFQPSSQAKPSQRQVKPAALPPDLPCLNRQSQHTHHSTDRTQVHCSSQVPHRTPARASLADAITPLLPKTEYKSPYSHPELLRPEGSSQSNPLDVDQMSDSSSNSDDYSASKDSNVHSKAKIPPAQPVSKYVYFACFFGSV